VKLSAPYYNDRVQQSSFMELLSWNMVYRISLSHSLFLMCLCSTYLEFLAHSYPKFLKARVCTPLPGILNSCVWDHIHNNQYRERRKPFCVLKDGKASHFSCTGERESGCDKTMQSWKSWGNGINYKEAGLSNIKRMSYMVPYFISSYLVSF